MVTPHLRWKFHANRSRRFLVMLLTKKQTKKQRKKSLKNTLSNNNPSGVIMLISLLTSCWSRNGKVRCWAHRRRCAGSILWRCWWWWLRITGDSAVCWCWWLRQLQRRRRRRILWHPSHPSTTCGFSDWSLFIRFLSFRRKFFVWNFRCTRVAQEKKQPPCYHLATHIQCVPKKWHPFGIWVSYHC